MDKPVVAITGANGFVGTLIARALEPHTRIVRLVRNPRQSAEVAWHFGMAPHETERILATNAVTHLIHAAWDMQSSSPARIKNDCVQGSIRLLQAAKATGIRKPIFVSTISAFSGTRSIYGRAKLEIEKKTLHHQGVVLRLGLVYGDGDGGLFGKLRKFVALHRIVPIIANGNMPQYLLHEHTLAEVVQRAVSGDFDDTEQALTVAHPQGLPFRDLIQQIARRQNREVTLVAVPWRLIFCALKLAEAAGKPLAFRSDNVLGLVFQNPAPDFSALRRYSIEPVHFRIL